MNTRTPNKQLTDKHDRLRQAAKNYQSTLSWYQENLDSPNAEQDCDEATAAFKREIGYREMDIIADLLDEMDELQERLKATMDSEPVAWTDEQELRDVDKDGFGYLFKVKPITPNADPRRIIKLYRHAQPAPVVQMVPEEPPEHLLPKGNSRDATYRRGAAIQAWKQCRAAMLKGGAA
ncbi:hypothetical protein AI2828V5_1358 [Klebsiella oxytoca]|uniref:hypothetical protein n=1 Tax=Klebsiella TaxID=570 RepID=UPI001A034EFE|nr:Uncharacterised protein [Klebsiella oxytoca]CAF2387411.1 hypothetical protein AI2828V5_1358 [Klebsiella oxytoca]CAH5815467.1 hypothetical protein AI2828V5_1358 [Klebsiella oxytoca]